VIRSGRAQGFSCIIDQGLTRATGDVVLVHAGVGRGELSPRAVLESLAGLHQVLPQGSGSSRSTHTERNGWQAVAGAELAAVRLRADQKARIHTRPPNFLARLRELAWGE
jgi:hypothetical protein